MPYGEDAAVPFCCCTVTVCGDVGVTGSLCQPSLLWMMLAVSVPVEYERTDLPSVSHAAVAEPYPSNIQLFSPRTCLFKQLVCRLSSHLHNLVVARCLPLEWDSYCCDWSWHCCAQRPHRVLQAD